VGYTFALVLSREITDDESAILREAGCAAAIFGTDSLPANAEVAVTKMDFDDTSSPSLAAAIESALDAVKALPDLSVPGLTVPVQSAGPLDEEHKVVSGEVEPAVVEVISEAVVAAPKEKPAAKKAATPRPRPSAKKATIKETADISASD
jgi:hypothetical protein